MPAAIEATYFYSGLTYPFFIGKIETLFTRIIFP